MFVKIISNSMTTENRKQQPWQMMLNTGKLTDKTYNIETKLLQHTIMQTKKHVHRELQKAISLIYTYVQLFTAQTL